MDTKDGGEEIKKLRKEAGMTQEELANKLELKYLRTRKFIMGHSQGEYNRRCLYGHLKTDTENGKRDWKVRPDEGSIVLRICYLNKDS